MMGNLRQGDDGGLTVDVDAFAHATVMADEAVAQLIRRMSIDQLADILRRYGEERYAGRIARAIKDGVQSGTITTTTELAALIARSVPTHEKKKDPATRAFQALRIAVNDELGQI